MKVERLSPPPTQQIKFAWSHHKTAPPQAGCYVLATYDNEVLYVGLATKSIRSRMGSHLDTPSKRIGDSLGVPFWFYYIERPAAEVGPIERGWMNQSILDDGKMPPLNKVYSPI